MAVRKKLTPDTSEIKRHIQRITDNHPFVVQTFPPKSNREAGNPKHKYFRTCGDAAIEYIVDASAAGMNVGLVPNVMNSKGRKAENCIKINWLFADFDSGNQTLKSILGLPVKPNLVVNTSEGRYHGYYAVTGCKVSDFSKIQKALAAACGSDPNVIDPSRCMRISGTINYNHKPQVLARIVYPESGMVNRKSRTLKQFMADMGLVLNGPDGKSVNSNVEQLLGQIDPNERENWLKVGKAIHSEWPDETGYERWKTWSQQSSQFDEQDQRETWATFKPNGGITLGTLVQLAKEGASTPPEIPESGELEFADAFAGFATGKIGYDPKAKTWWVFTGVVWEPSKGDHFALKMVKEWLADLGRKHGDGKAVSHLQRMAVMKPALSQVQLDSRIAIDESTFDADPHLLGMKNGVVDLRTGEFRAACAEDRLTRHTTVAFDPDAKCPEFWKFMKSVTKGRKKLVFYLLRAMGYTLTGLTREHKFFILLGETRNGKGVLMNTLSNFLGDLAVSVSPALLMRAYAGNANASSPALMRLRGARLLLCTELTKGKPLDEAFIKQLTGGDKLAGRENYGNQTEFYVSGKLWISSNEDPEIPYGAEAMWARIVGLPFDVRFDDEKDDKFIGEKLKAEAPGIMNLLIKRARLYLEKGGLPDCPEMKAATTKLRKKLDTVQSWVNAYCRKIESARLPSSVAYLSYKRHAKELRRPPISQPAFKKALAAKGFQPGRGHGGNYFSGLRLLRD